MIKEILMIISQYWLCAYFRLDHEKSFRAAEVLPTVKVLTSKTGAVIREEVGSVGEV